MAPIQSRVTRPSSNPQPRECLASENDHFCKLSRPLGFWFEAPAVGKLVSTNGAVLQPAPEKVETGLLSSANRALARPVVRGPLGHGESSPRHRPYPHLVVCNELDVALEEHDGIQALNIPAQAGWARRFDCRPRRDPGLTCSRSVRQTAPHYLLFFVLGDAFHLATPSKSSVSRSMAQSLVGPALAWFMTVFRLPFMTTVVYVVGKSVISRL